MNHNGAANKDEINFLAKTFNQDLSIEEQEDLNEDTLIHLISSRVLELLDHDKDLLMSYLYRLDIPESQAHAATRMTNQVPLHQSIGLLIYYRQLERVRTKKKYIQPDLGEEWGL